MDPDSGDENENGEEDMEQEANIEEQPKDYWEEQQMARQITNFDPHNEADEEGAKNAEIHVRQQTCSQ